VAGRKWRGVHLSVETRREYTLGNAASEILGRTDLDDSGVDGLELQLDDELRGRPGWATLFRVGRNRTVGLPRGLRRAPTDGQSAVLTLDLDLQGIVEHHLARAVWELCQKKNEAGIGPENLFRSHFLHPGMVLH